MNPSLFSSLSLSSPLTLSLCRSLRRISFVSLFLTSDAVTAPLERKRRTEKRPKERERETERGSPHFSLPLLSLSLPLSPPLCVFLLFLSLPIALRQPHSHLFHCVCDRRRGERQSVRESAKGGGHVDCPLRNDTLRPALPLPGFTATTAPYRSSLVVRRARAWRLP